MEGILKLLEVMGRNFKAFEDAVDARDRVIEDLRQAIAERDEVIQGLREKISALEAEGDRAATE